MPAVDGLEHVLPHDPLRGLPGQANVQAGHVLPLQGGLRQRQAIGIRLRSAAGAQGPFQLGGILDEGPLLGECAPRTSTTRGVAVPLPQRRWAAISPMSGRALKGFTRAQPRPARQSAPLAWRQGAWPAPGRRHAGGAVSWPRRAPTRDPCVHRDRCGNAIHPHYSNNAHPYRLIRYLFGTELGPFGTFMRG